MKFLLLALSLSLYLHAETGIDAWLRYQRMPQPPNLPATVVALDSSEVETSAQKEIIRGIQGISGRTNRASTILVDEDSIVLATTQQIRKTFPAIKPPAGLIPDAFWLKSFTHSGHRVILITALNDRGVLYGAFAFLRLIVTHHSVETLDLSSSPYQPIRWVNEWDNLDGTIERGYAGRSIFFEDDNVRSRSQLAPPDTRACSPRSASTAAHQ